MRRSSFRKACLSICPAYSSVCVCVCCCEKSLSLSSVRLFCWHKGAWVGVCGCVLQRRQSSKLNWKCLIAQRFVVAALSTGDCIPDIVSHFTSRTKMQENPAIKKPQGYGRGPTWPVKKRAAGPSPSYCSECRKGQQDFFFFFPGKVVLCCYIRERQRKGYKRQVFQVHFQQSRPVTLT